MPFTLITKVCNQFLRHITFSMEEYAITWSTKYAIKQPEKLILL